MRKIASIYILMQLIVFSLILLSCEDEVYLEVSDIEKICEGKKNTDTAKYYQTSGVIHPICIFRNTGEGYVNESDTSIYSPIPGEWVVPIDDLSKTELVLCENMTDSTLYHTCTGYSNGGVVNQYSTIYERRLISSYTGSVLAKETVEGEHRDECDFLWIFHGDDLTDEQYDVPADSSYTPFVQPYVYP